MNVCFSGLKNATSTFIINEQPYNILRSGFSFYVPEGKDILLNVQLDNNGDKDLENFKEILKKFPPKIGKDFVSFSFEEQQVPGRKRDFKYFLNGRILEINDENLPIFSKLSKLMEKVQNPLSFHQESSYLEGENCSKALYSIMLAFSKYVNQINIGSMIDYAFDPSRIANTASKMREQIQNDMMDYFV